ncbi:MAG TPA: hypothetical protein VHA37_00070, partial [Candidatus Saccharimonadales bacterium]|nr:hypothetical protein [Candidatus Saccharimonadales bacterium]
MRITATIRSRAHGTASAGSAAPGCRGKRLAKGQCALWAVAILMMAAGRAALGLNPAKAITQYM